MDLKRVICSKRGEEEAGFPTILTIILSIVIGIVVLVAVYYIIKKAGGS